MNLQFDINNKKNWIYFCQGFFLKDYIKLKDSTYKGTPTEFTIHSSNPKFYHILKIKIKNNLFGPQLDFSQLNLNLKIKNTKYFKRAKNIKIFFNFHNYEAVKQLTFNSIFRRQFTGIKENNFLISSFYNLINTKKIYYKFDNPETYLSFEEMEEINSYPEYDSKLNFAFPDLFNFLDYKLVEQDPTVSFIQEIYLDLDLSKYKKALASKFVQFIEFLSNGNFTTYLKNNYAWENDEIIQLLDILNPEFMTDEIYKINQIFLISSMLKIFGKVIFSNTLDIIQNPSSFDIANNPEPNLFFDFTNSVTHKFPISSLKIPLDMLSSYNYIIFELIDSKNSLLFRHFEPNFLNDFAIKRLQTPNESLKEQKLNIIQKPDTYIFDKTKTFINCFWINFKNIYYPFSETSSNTKTISQFTYSYLLNSKMVTNKISIETLFQVEKKEIINFRHYSETPIANISLKYEFDKDFQVSNENELNLKNDFFKRNWSYYCSFINLNSYFESFVFLNNMQIYKFQAKGLDLNDIQKNINLQYSMTNQKAFLADFRLNLIPLLSSDDFPNLYFTYKYKGFPNTLDSLYSLSLIPNPPEKNTILKYSLLKDVEFIEETFLNNYIYLDSSIADFTQVFYEGFPKFDKFDDQFLRIRIRFNPDLIFKLFYKTKDDFEFLYSMYKNFNYLKENINNPFSNNSTLFKQEIEKTNSSIFSYEKTLAFTINDKILLISFPDLLKEFSTFTFVNYTNSIPEIIKLKITDIKFDICLFSQNYNYLKPYPPFENGLLEKKWINVWNKNELISSTLAFKNEYESDEIPFFRKQTFDDFNYYTSKMFFTSFYIDNLLFNYTYILIKNPKNFCLQNNILYSYNDGLFKNLESASYFDTQSSKVIDNNLSIKFFLNENDNFNKYNITQISTGTHSSFSKYSFRLDFEMDTFLQEQANEFSLFNYLFQSIESKDKYLSINNYEFLNLGMFSICNRNSEFTKTIINNALFTGLEKKVNIYQETNIINLKNSFWSFDISSQPLVEKIDNNKVYFTIENNYENILNVYSKINFSNNLNELKIEHKNDEEFVNILNNIYIKIELFKNYKNKKYVYALQFSYLNKTLIEKLNYNEYFFIDIKVINPEEGWRWYKGDLNSYKETLNDYEYRVYSENPKINIKIYLERFTFKTYSYFNSEKETLTYYYSLEHIFNPIWISINKFKSLINNFLQIEGENSQKYIPPYFQFSGYKVKKYSNKLVSITLKNTKFYSFYDIKMNIISAISGMIYSGIQRITESQNIPFINLKFSVTQLQKCEINKLFLFYKTNILYSEQPDLKTIKLTFFDKFNIFFINPICFPLIKSLVFTNFNIINYSFDLIRMYNILNDVISINTILTVKMVNIQYDLIFEVNIKFFKYINFLDKQGKSEFKKSVHFCRFKFI